MRAAVLTSNSLRHRYFIQAARSRFDVAIALQEPKKPGATNTAQAPSDAVQDHFKNLAQAETAEFGDLLKANDRVPAVAVDGINDPALVARVQRQDIDIVLLFGTSILSEDWLSAFPGRIVNLHLGLSPFYRGSATLFWPIANGELECVGATAHLAVQKVDAGPILRRIKPDFRTGDSYYALTTRLIRKAIDTVPQIAVDYLAGRIQPLPQPPADTKAYRKRDFDHAALRRALDFIGNGLTAEQITAAARSERCVCSQ